MAQVHNFEALETEIKNLKLELSEAEKDAEICRVAAHEATLKVATICTDYEGNQIMLIRQNKAQTIEINRLKNLIEEIQEVVKKEKVKSSTLKELLKNI